MKYLFLIVLTIQAIFLKAEVIDSSKLALVFIDTRGNEINGDLKINGTLKIFYKGSGILNRTSDMPHYYGNIGIEYRGHYSQSLPQKPFDFETRDSLQNELNVSLFGLSPEHDWILLANYNDKSFARNPIAFEFFRQMGHWAPHTILCELYLNEVYQGIYTFTEKIKRDKGRVDISKMDEDDNAGDSLTGGYIFKVDYWDSDAHWTSNYYPPGFAPGSVNFLYEYPQTDNITSQQMTYLKNQVNKFENTLFGADFRDVKYGYSRYIDVQSFIDYFLVGEVTRNVDAYKKSCFYSKQSDKKGGLISAGPVWDFDWSMKNFNECIYSNIDGSGWAYKIFDCWPNPVPPAWMLRLVSDSTFVQHVNTRYFELRNTIFSESFISNYLDSVKTLVSTAQQRHYQLWNILGQNVGTPEIDGIPTTYEGEVAKLNYWFKTRMNWLDDNMIDVSSIVSPVQLENSLSISVFPNPATDNINVRCDHEITKICILSVDGILLQENLCSSTDVNIQLKDLNSGIYCLQVLTETGENSIIKLAIR